MSTASSPAPATSRPVIAAVVTDVIAVLVFVILGRESHGEGSALVALAQTLWPFLVGAAVGWVALLVVRSRTGLAVDAPAAGGIVAAGTVVVGMLVRHLAGRGTPVTFILVATAFLTFFLVGWRLMATLLERRRAAQG